MKTHKLKEGIIYIETLEMTWLVVPEKPHYFSENEKEEKHDKREGRRYVYLQNKGFDMKIQSRASMLSDQCNREKRNVILLEEKERIGGLLRI